MADRYGAWTPVRTQYPPSGVFVRVMVGGGRELVAKHETSAWLDPHGNVLAGPDRPMLWREKGDET